MDEPKPVASLGPTLLARKGGAKPAMRPQAAGLLPIGASDAHAVAADLDDLGWNDMGEDDAPMERSAEVLQLTPSPPSPEGRVAEAGAKAEAKVEKIKPRPEAKAAEPASRRIVKTMHEELAERMAQEAQAVAAAKGGQPIPLRRNDRAAKPPVRAATAAKKAAADTEIVDLAPRPAARIRKAGADSRRAAFTLRLDAKRHLKLRLASTVRNLSAQQLVTEALDRFLKDIPEIELLARQVRLD